MIYPVDSAIHRSNNWGQVCSSCLASSGDANAFARFLFGWLPIFVETSVVFQMDLSLKEGSIELAFKTMISW